MAPLAPRTTDERLLALELTTEHTHELIADMHQRLFGNHQPGALALLEERVGVLEGYRSRAMGFFAACCTFGAGAGAVGAILAHWFRR